MQKPSKKKKYLRISAIIVLSLLLLVAIGGIIAFSKREALLEKAIVKAINKAKKDYNLNVQIGKARFIGLRSVNMKNISVVPQDRDTLAQIQDFTVSIKLWPLIFGNIKLAELYLDKGSINLIRKDSISNYDFLFRKNKADTVKNSQKIDLAVMANNLLNQMLYKIPDDMDIKDFDIKFRDDTNSFNLYTTHATIDGGEIKSTIKVNNTESIWHVEGNVSPGDKQLNIMLFAEGKKVELPFIENRYGLKLNFDTIHTELKNAKKRGDEFEISGSWSIKNLLVNHARIASNDVIVPNASIDANMVFGEDYVSIDSTSLIHLKNIEARPYLKYKLGSKEIIELKLHTEQLDAQSLFNSFPIGLFESLEGIQVAGKLQYDLNFYLNTAKPNDVIFDSRLNKKDFKVIKWGKTNFQKINSSFVYTPFEYGKPMRNISIGPNNPDFTPIEEISPYLRNALLTAEDPSFYRHKGFVTESIRKSIATNFIEKDFKRGGSTISMQLVKNVYLSRKKTVARKIEEILIVWIMENGRLSNKHRMFEVYLNLIEWGRNVYGIGEASRFYFGKHPSQLDLGESIFLASIVPRPKSGLYFFQGDGYLRTGLRGYFKLIGGLMAKHGMTVRDSNAYGFYGVRLREGLRREPDVDSIAIDSLIDFTEEEDSNGILQKIFGKRKPDTIDIKNLDKLKVIPADTSKTPAQNRQERREKRKREKEENE